MARPMSEISAPGRTASIAQVQALLGDLHQAAGLRVDAPDAERRVGVAVDAVDVDRDVEVHDVAVDQGAVVRDAVADDLVDRRAHRLREAAVPQRAGVDPARHVGLVRDAVELVGGDADRDRGAGLGEHVARDLSRPRASARSPRATSPPTRSTGPACRSRRSRAAGSPAAPRVRVRPRPPAGASCDGSACTSCRCRTSSSSFARSIIGSPAAVDPLLQVRPLGPDRGVEPVAGQHQEVGGQGEEPAVDRLDDLLEVAAGQRRVPRRRRGRGCRR